MTDSGILCPQCGGAFKSEQTMTDRDWFAGLAMAAQIVGMLGRYQCDNRKLNCPGCWDCTTCRDVARASYEFANDMSDERARIVVEDGKAAAAVERKPDYGL